MLNHLSNSFAWAFSAKIPEDIWKSDSLTHPDIRQIETNQITDLPIWAARYHDGGGGLHLRITAISGTCRRSGGARCLSIALLGALLLLAEPFWLSAEAQAEPSEKLAAFAMPADIEQWHPDIIGMNGAYRFREVDGECQITFAQNRGVNAARASGQDLHHSVNSYIDRVAERMERLERTEVDAVKIKSYTNERIPFVSMEFAYMGEDKAEYQSRISAAWLGDVELLVIAACPVSEWLAGRVLIDEFMDKVSISQVSNP